MVLQDSNLLDLTHTRQMAFEGTFVNLDRFLQFQFSLDCLETFIEDVGM